MSYLSGRVQTVSVDGAKSQPRQLEYGVPQGSVLGPILFTNYTLPLGKIADKYGLNYHLYADDTQLYLSFKPGCTSEATLAKNKLESCIEEIKQWMNKNMLKLNDEKTELLLLTTQKMGSKHSFNGINIGNSNSKITTSEKVKNLGVIFDSTLRSESYVSQICKVSHYHLHNISRVRRSLTTEAARSFIHAYVTSRLDYCNSLLYKAPKTTIDRLQKVQNYAARVITMTASKTTLHQSWLNSTGCP